MSSRIYLLFPPRGHKPPPTLCGRLNLHHSLRRRRFPIPLYVKRPDDALYAVGSLVLLPTPSSPHYTLEASEHDSLWQSPAAHLDERPRLQKYFRVQRCLNAFTPGYLKVAVIRGLPKVWALALCRDDAEQDPVVYGAEFGVVFPAKGPRTAFI